MGTPLPVLGATWRLLDAPEKRRSVILILAAVLSTALEAAALLLLLPFIGGLLGEAYPSALTQTLSRLGISSPLSISMALALCVLGLFISRSAVSMLLLWKSLSLGRSVEVRLGGEVLESAARAAPEQRGGHAVADAMEAINLAAERVSLLVGTSVAAMGDIVLVLAVLAIMLAVSPIAGLLMVGVIGTALLAWSRWSRRRLSAAGIRLREERAARYRTISECVALHRELTLSGRADAFLDAARAQSMTITSANRLANFIIPSTRYVLETVLVLAVTAAATATWLATSSGALLAALGVLLVASLRALPSLYRLVQISSLARFSGASVAAFSKPGHHTLAPTPHAGERPRPSTHQRHTSTPLVELKDVSVRYRDAPISVLERVCLRIEPGARLAVTGPSGVGKSTLVEVILGLLQPTSGEVLANGQPVSRSESAMREYQSIVGYVPQEITVIAGTVADNICLGIPAQERDLGRLWSSLGAAGLAETVAALPDGINAILGPEGVHLSGGQRQRLGLARALYDGPKLLVLDEPTAHLDPSAEANVIASLEQLPRDITQIRVAHTQNLIRGCDMELCLETTLQSAMPNGGWPGGAGAH